MFVKGNILHVLDLLQRSKEFDHIKILLESANPFIQPAILFARLSAEGFAKEEPACPDERMLQIAPVQSQLVQVVKLLLLRPPFHVRFLRILHSDFHHFITFFIRLESQFFSS